MTDSQSAPRTADARRRQLLDVARERFVAEGYARTSVAAIVGAAGVAQGTFYLYFPSKQAVLAELRREVFRDYEQGLLATAALPLPADERLVRTVLTMVELVRRNEALEAVFRSAESAEATERAALEGRARLARSAVRFLDDGVAAGQFTADDAELVAAFVVTLFDNVLYEAIRYERPAPLARVVPAALRFTLRAVGVGEARIAALLADLPLLPASPPPEAPACP